MRKSNLILYFTVLFVSSSLLACGPEAPTADAGGLDAGPDAGARDAGARDSGATDAGPDAGTDGGTDAGSDAGPVPRPYPAPEAWGPNLGPGGPARTFSSAQLGVTCTYLIADETDHDHHNLVTMVEGYLLMPWADAAGGGGLTFWDISDPCAPVRVGVGLSPNIRETHAIGAHAQDGGLWAVVDQMTPPGDAGGIQIWDIHDPTAPTPVAELELPGFVYPDAYARVSLSVFWQAPYIYVGGADNGVWIVDAHDPLAPALAGQLHIEPTLRVGQVQAVGDLLVVTSAEGARAVLFDISDPTAPQPIPGGDFLTRDATGTPREHYFSTFSGGYLYLARKDSGGGLIVYDLRDPERPAFAGDYPTGGNGGYVFIKDELAFLGDSVRGDLFDVRDPSSIFVRMRVSLVGDLDTVTPIGNVAVLSVDELAEPGRGSAVVPYEAAPDTRPPSPTWAWPADGATDLPLGSRFGVTFSEFLDPGSAFEGSVRLYRADLDPALGRVDGHISVQEGILNFVPEAPLSPATEYILELPAGGLSDFNGNALTETVRYRYRTAG